jgi:hypothetical protein
MRVLLALLVLVILSTVGEAQRAPDTTCVRVAALDTSMPPLKLPGSVATVRLPDRGTVKGSLPTGWTLVLEDSTLIDLWVTPEPATGFASSTGARPVDFRFCDIALDNHSATVTRVTLIMPGRDSVFVGVLNVQLDPEHALNVSVSTATAESRDAMLGMVAGNLEFRGSRF